MAVPYIKPRTTSLFHLDNSTYGSLPPSLTSHTGIDDHAFVDSNSRYRSVACRGVDKLDKSPGAQVPKKDPAGGVSKSKVSNCVDMPFFCLGV